MDELANRFSMYYYVGIKYQYVSLDSIYLRTYYILWGYEVNF